MITVVLLALLILVLVSTATLTRIETSIGFNSRRHSQAQQNALFALNRAVGELQRHAGLDNRVTAIADGSLVPPANPLFTGVWPSAVGATVESWLVSGNEYPNGPLDVNDSTVIPEPAADNESVWLVNAGSVVDAAWSSVVVYSAGEHVRHSGAYYKALRRSVGEQPPNAALWRPFDPRVKVIKQPLYATISDGTSAIVGKYAWWVGDEGVKTAISVFSPLDLVDIISPNTDYSNPINQRRLGRLAQREMGRIHAHDPGFSTTYFFTDTTLSNSQKDDLRRVLTRNQFPMVSGALGLSVFRQRFHDVTPMSFAVLANSRAGGLRQDLSNPSASVQTDALRAYLSTRPVGSVGGLGLVPIHDLRPLIGGTGGSTDPFFSIAPVLLKAVIGLKVTLPVAPGGGQPTREWKADLVFWNPYNARLNIPASGFVAKFDNPPTLMVAGQQVDWKSSVNTVDNLLGLTVPATAFVGNVMDPGETVTFSLSFSSVGSLTTPTGPGTSGPMNLGPAPYSIAMESAPVGGPPLPTKIGLYADGSLMGETELELFPATSLLPVQIAGDDFYVGLGFELNATTDGSWLRNVEPRGRVRQVDGAIPSVFRTDNGAKTVLLDSVPSDPAESFLVSSQHALFELPSAENVSIGALQHLGFGNTDDGFSASFRLGNADSLGVNAWADEYFFSGIPSSVGGGPDEVWNPQIHPLPNGSLVPFNPPGGPPLTVSTSITLGADANDRFPASRLLVRGAFNLNSTSILAWTSLLAGALSPDWGGNGTDIGSAFSHFPHSAEVFGPDPEYRPDTANEIRTQGIRFLTTLQKERLAEVIVGLLHARSRPFGSLEEFLDSGLLDDAISTFDATNGIGLEINRAFSGYPEIPRFAAAYLGQAELFNSWAPFLQARSDTFVVRTYGETRNPVTQLPEARAWCEAIVQRVPDYVNSGQNQAPWETATGNNAVFGRRFQVIQFRWLSPADI